MSPTNSTIITDSNQRMATTLVENAEMQITPDQDTPSSSEDSEYYSIQTETQSIPNQDTPSSSSGSEQFSKEELILVDGTIYGTDIFEYLKEKEMAFPICDYMNFQKNISKGMRSLLVDWMVELQESFELHHETLYLAVNIVDSYLCHVIIFKEELQLLGASALFIANKYEERKSLSIEAFMYMCNGAYTRQQLICMERNVLFALDYELGYPLSYNFLRHYARSANVSIPTLTLARYILEMSLLDYEAVALRGSKMAAAALFMAMRMHGDAKPWTRTLEDCSSYELEEFATNVAILNTGLHNDANNSDTTYNTIPCKYSNRIYYEVATVPLKTTEELFETYEGLNDFVEIELELEKQAVYNSHQGASNNQ